jgi:glutathione S-transferase
MELFTYYRSTSSYRVRIALALKGLDYQALPVNLLKGEQRGGLSGDQPAGRVPALRTDGGELLMQSPAIIEYLEEVIHSRRCCRPLPRRAPRCVAWRRSSAATCTRCTTSVCSTSCASWAR